MGTRAAAGQTGRRGFRRLWLPKVLYEALPWIYCGLGAAALLSGLFLPHPGWLAPYLLLLALTCLHGAAWCVLLRRRYRLGRLQRARRGRPPAGPAFPDAAVM